MTVLTDKHIRIANAPCSWGALEFELEGKSLGYEQVLNEIAETGYVGTELGDWGFMPTDPQELAKELAKRQLVMLGAFVPVALADEKKHEDGIQKASKVAKLMFDAGYHEAFIVLADENGTISDRTNNAGRIGNQYHLTRQQKETFARGAENVARAVKDQFGLRTVFHHHCAGYIETPEEIEELLSMTDPNLLGLCFDTGHYMFGGGKDARAFLDKHWSRVWHLHFKDFSSGAAQEAARNNWNYFDSVKNGVFCELGKGVVDFRAIKELIVSKGYDGWIVVEQDVLPGMGNPKACAEKNRNYLRSIGL